MRVLQSHDGKAMFSVISREFDAAMRRLLAGPVDTLQKAQGVAQGLNSVMELPKVATQHIEKGNT